MTVFQYTKSDHKQCMPVPINKYISYRNINAFHTQVILNTKINKTHIVFKIDVCVNLKKTPYFYVHVVVRNNINKFILKIKLYLSRGNSTANNQTHQDKGVHTGKE